MQYALDFRISTLKILHSTLEIEKKQKKSKSEKMLKVTGKVIGAGKGK